MLKVLGMILCAAALCCLGFVAVWTSGKRIEAGKEALRFIRLLENEICDLKKPPDEALRDISYAGKLPKLLLLEKQPWEKEKIRNRLKECGLGNEECEIVGKLLTEILSMQSPRIEVFTTAIGEMEAILQMREEALKSTGSLYPKLGILAGLALILLFL